MDFLVVRHMAFRKRRDMVVAMLNDAPGLACPVPEGAFYVYPDASGVIGTTTPKGLKIATDEDLINYFLDEARVAAVHGAAFGLSPAFRVCYATSEEVLKKACTRIQEIGRSEEHTSELQSLMRISYAVFCLKKKKKT